MDIKLINKFLSLEVDHLSLLDDYSKFCHKLLYLDPELIILVTHKLKKNIIDWASQKSLVYKNEYNSSKIFTREELSDKKNWYVDDLKDESMNFSTSGSTTGEPFSYLVWKKYKDYIEEYNQYGMILEEFNLKQDHLDILILMKLAYNPYFEDDVFYKKSVDESYYSMHTHKSKNSTRYFLNFKGYVEQSEDWHKKLFDFMGGKVFDLVMTTGPMINTLNLYIKKLDYKKKFARLISQTGEFLIKADATYLKNNDYTEGFCDHMRCWDGGATFFTCSHGTYHLMENLSFVEEIDGKMISTDYFSFPSPFVNYWNGDICSIKNNYEKCECGRYYRPFKMLENRPFALKGQTKLSSIKEQIKQLGFKNEIVQIKFDNLNINITSKRELFEQEKNDLQGILNEYKIIYYY